MIPTQDIYWLAGLLEGEGYFGYGNGAQIVVKMTDEDVLTKARTIIGLENTSFTTHDPGPPRKRAYVLLINGPKAIGTMMTIFQLMCERRKQKIKKVLESWRRAKGARHQWKTCKYGHEYQPVPSHWKKAGIRKRWCRTCAIQGSRKRYLKQIKVPCPMCGQPKVREASMCRPCASKYRHFFSRQLSLR